MPREWRLALTLAIVKELSGAELDALIAEAAVDCYGEDEELTGLATVIADNMAVPFETTVLGVAVTVRKIDQIDSGIVAICVRGKHWQAIPVLDLPLRSASMGSRVDRRLPPLGTVGGSRDERVSVLRVPRAGPAADRGAAG